MTEQEIAEKDPDGLDQLAGDEISIGISRISVDLVIRDLAPLTRTSI